MNSIQNIHALTASYQILKNQPEMEQQALYALPLELQERVIKIVGSALSITLQGALAQVAMESVQELPVESLSRIYSVFTNMCGEGDDPDWAQVHIGDIDKVDSFFEVMKSVLPEFKQFNQYLDLAINPSRFSVIESLVTGCAGTTISNYLGAEGILNLSACSKMLHTIMPDVYYESKAASFSSWKQSISLDLANDPKIVLLKPEEGLSVAAIKKHVDAQIDAIYNIVLEKGTVDDLLGFLSHGLDCQANSNKKEELAKQFIENKDVSRLRALEPFLPMHFLDSTILRMIALNRWDHIEVITKSIRGLSLSSANYIIRTAILNDRVEYVRDLFKEFKDTMPSELNQAKEFLHEKLIESSSIMYLIQSGDFTEAKRRLESGHILLGIIIMMFWSL
ncbi:MAG: hypothetical protein FJZ57_00940 [Chlamydiae bacterium]|nr:hypothetical protein [Chlamydiota bacterium]